MGWIRENRLWWRCFGFITSVLSYDMWQIFSDCRHIFHIQLKIIFESIFSLHLSIFSASSFKSRLFCIFFRWNAPPHFIFILFLQFDDVAVYFRGPRSSFTLFPFNRRKTHCGSMRIFWTWLVTYLPYHVDIFNDDG